MNQVSLFVFIFISGCGQANQDYFPLGEKISREYIIEEQVNDETQVSKSIVTSLPAEIINEQMVYPHHYASGETYYFSKSTEGISVTNEPGQPGNTIIGYPLETGIAWQTETRIGILDQRHESFSGDESFISPGQRIVLDFQIVSLDDSVKVPAGKFFNCMRIDGKGMAKVEARTRGLDHILIEQTDWYARGIGLIKRTRTEKSVPQKYSGTHTLELARISD